MTHIIRVVERLIRHRAGNVTIEFGFVILFMATLAVGAYDFGNLGYQKIALTSAARAGAQYGVQDQVTAANTTGMVQAHHRAPVLQLSGPGRGFVQRDLRRRQLLLHVRRSHRGGPDRTPVPLSLRDLAAVGRFDQHHAGALADPWFWDK